MDDGLTGIQRAIFLKKAGVETAVDDKFLLNPPSRAGLLESAIKNMTRLSIYKSVCLLPTSCPSSGLMSSGLKPSKTKTIFDFSRIFFF